MVTTRQQLATASTKHYGGTNRRHSVTVHETANLSPGATAAMHARLQDTGGGARNASWHWQVDDTEAVQSFPHTTQCWHAGDGRGAGNLDSIAVEVCVNADGDFAAAVRNAAELVASILRTEGLSVADVVQHNHWSGKNCPTFLRSGARGVTWDGFLDLVRGQAPAPAGPAGPAGPAPLVVDGSFGPLTKKALQRALGVAQDGSIGPITVRALQTFLNGRGARLAVDGSWGPLTTKALQRHLGVAADGSFGPISIRALQARLNGGSL